MPCATLTFTACMHETFEFSPADISKALPADMEQRLLVFKPISSINNEDKSDIF